MNLFRFSNQLVHTCPVFYFFRDEQTLFQLSFRFRTGTSAFGSPISKLFLSKFYERVLFLGKVNLPNFMKLESILLLMLFEMQLESRQSGRGDLADSVGCRLIGSPAISIGSPVVWISSLVVWLAHLRIGRSSSIGPNRSHSSVLNVTERIWTAYHLLQVDPSCPPPAPHVAAFLIIAGHIAGHNASHFDEPITSWPSRPLRPLIFSLHECIYLREVSVKSPFAAVNGFGRLTDWPFGPNEWLNEVRRVSVDEWVCFWKTKLIPKPLLFGRVLFTKLRSRLAAVFIDCDCF